METEKKPIEKVVVKFNNVVIFSSSNKSIAVEFAIMLHRASNEPHSIDICSKDCTIVSMFTRK